MQKPLTLFLLICLALPSIALSQTSADDEEGVRDVVLDKTEAVTICPWRSAKSRICKGEELNISISTIVQDAKKKGLSFYYLVSGGKIVGNGANVVWDLTGIKPGYYLIAVGVGKDGILEGKLITKTIPLIECPVCDRNCECAVISVSGPTAPAKRGETIIFTAHVVGGTQSSIEYNWAISSGTIVSEQGTPNILVRTNKDKKEQTITATVEIGGLCPECPRTASATVELKNK